MCLSLDFLALETIDGCLTPAGFLQFLHLHASVHFCPERMHGHLTIVVYLLFTAMQFSLVDCLCDRPQEQLGSTLLS